MRCGKCPYTDGLVYTSLPPKVKCTVTGEFHEYADLCDCENARKVKENINRYAAAKGEQALERSQEVSNFSTTSGEPIIPIQATEINSAVTEIGTTAVASIFNSACAEIGTPCLICGETVEIGYFGGSPKICEECKQAVLHVKELLKKSEEGVAILD